MDPFSQLILTISVTSFLTFQWLFHKVSPWMSMRISRGFLGLSDKQKVEWNSRWTVTMSRNYSHALCTAAECELSSASMLARSDSFQLSPKILTVNPHISCDIVSDSPVGCIVCCAMLALWGTASRRWQHSGKSIESWFLWELFSAWPYIPLLFWTKKIFRLFFSMPCLYCILFYSPTSLLASWVYAACS